MSLLCNIKYNHFYQYLHAPYVLGNTRTTMAVNNGKLRSDLEQIPKNGLSSDCRLKLAYMAGGDKEALIFKKGEILRKVPQEIVVDELMKEIEKLAREEEI